MRRLSFDEAESEGEIKPLINNDIIGDDKNEQ